VYWKHCPTFGRTVYAALAAGGVSNELMKSAVKRIERVLVLLITFIYFLQLDISSSE
jgi:hypothetical protein